MPDLRLLRPCLTSMWRWTCRTRSTLFRKLCATAAPNFTQERKNMVAFSYGVRSSQSDNSCTALQLEKVYAACVITEFIRLGAKRAFLHSHASSLGQRSTCADLLDADKVLGVILGSVKEGPRVRMVARICVSLAGDARAAMEFIVKNYEK
ncbi:hypothetical protein C3747_269g18 [Trypanosoma cruzi]|uniref:Uncharacterized protein n=1 Tax=Trypanosoma cruzi TaxID=5693 RepID=A0A2V2VFJ9_TRYCR|nr:hypothetical protein C3747_269g18 [Trypanosoma cruzi]